MRPKTAAEKAFCALGPIAEAFITGAAAAGNTRLGPRAGRARTPWPPRTARRLFLDALDRAVAFGRWRAADVRSILAAGAGTPQPTPGRGRPRARAAPRPDPVAGRLHHRAPRTTGRRSIRRERRPRRRWPPTSSTGCAGSSWPRCAGSPRSCCVTAKTQRWAPEELLRTLVEAEITARDASNARTRLKAAAFPVLKTLDEFDRRRVLDPAGDLRLPRLAWNGSPPAENLCLVGPAGTGKSHLLVALGVAAVDAGHRVRYFTAAELVETLYRGLADNTVGRVIDTLLRNDLIICRRGRVRPARRHRRPAAVPVRRRRLRTPRPRHRLATGPSSPGAGSCPNTPPPSACSTGSCTTPTSWSPTASPTACAKPEPDRRRHHKKLINPRGGDFYLATSGDHNLAVDTPPVLAASDRAAHIALWAPRALGDQWRTALREIRQSWATKSACIVALNADVA